MEILSGHPWSSDDGKSRNLVDRRRRFNEHQYRTFSFFLIYHILHQTPNVFCQTGFIDIDMHFYEKLYFIDDRFSRISASPTCFIFSSLRHYVLLLSTKKYKKITNPFELSPKTKYKTKKSWLFIEYWHQ